MAAKKRKKAAAKAPARTPAFPATVEFKYIFPETYNPVYSNGVYGGISSQGDLSVNFYHERAPIPYASVHRLSPDGRVGEELSREPQTQDRPVIVRYVTTGVVMNMEAARRLHDWLGVKLQQFEELTKVPNGNNS